MKKNRRSLLIGVMAGVAVFALAQMRAFAQTTTPTATTTTSMLLVPEKPAASAHDHAMTSAPAAQQTATPQHMRKGMSMHKPDWSKMPTGSANTTVQPLDASTVPKFVNQLTRPATFVPSGTKFDRQLGRNVPIVQVTENTIFQQVLPPGFPKTKM